MPLAPDTNCLKWKIAGAAFVWEGGNTNVCGPKLTIFLFRLCLHLSFIGFFYLFRTPSARQQPPPPSHSHSHPSQSNQYSIDASAIIFLL